MTGLFLKYLTQWLLLFIFGKLLFYPYISNWLQFIASLTMELECIPQNYGLSPDYNNFYVNRSLTGEGKILILQQIKLKGELYFLQVVFLQQMITCTVRYYLWSLKRVFSLLIVLITWNVFYCFFIGFCLDILLKFFPLFTRLSSYPKCSLNSSLVQSTTFRFQLAFG